MQRIFTLILIVCVCSSCEPASQPWNAPWQTIAGRDPAITQPIYRARIPAHWQRVDPLPDESLADTTKPLCRLLILASEGQIDITIHNFPTDTIDQRIPPQSQVARWQRQLGDRASNTDSIRPFAHGGFVGLFFEADGLLAWSLQLAPSHYRTLSLPPASHLNRQLRADYTIKATGPESALAHHRSDILAFARSFELIAEIPSDDASPP